MYLVLIPLLPFLALLTSTTSTIRPFAAATAAGVRGMTVPDSAVRSAMKTAFERLKVVFEPSGAASLAALLGGKEEVGGKTVLVVASGGNVSPADFFGHIGHA